MNEIHISAKNLPNDLMIDGVKFKMLKSWPDDRGFFREVVRKTDDVFDGEKFSQWSHSKMTKDVVKAWHYHHVQVDFWYVPLGVVETVLFDNRPLSPTYKTKLVIKMGDSSVDPDALELCVKIPQGVLHGCKVVSPEAHLFYITSENYNPKDEGRLPYNSEIVGHNWGINAITVENDRRTFQPDAPLLYTPTGFEKDASDKTASGLQLNIK